jgi:hypothetical protein
MPAPPEPRRQTYLLLDSLDRIFPLHLSLLDRRRAHRLYVNVGVRDVHDNFGACE